MARFDIAIVARKEVVTQFSVEAASREDAEKIAVEAGKKIYPREDPPWILSFGVHDAGEMVPLDALQEQMVPLDALQELRVNRHLPSIVLATAEALADTPSEAT